MMTSTDMSRVIAAYAERFHAGLEPGHQVASPLGCWLLLALCGTAGSGRTREELADVLGVDVDTAAGVVAALLGHPHPLVGSAAGVWNRPMGDPAALAGWLSGLPEPVQTGDLPDQDALDAWASAHTLGLIERFPLQVTAETVMMLASALATRISWDTPFDLVPAGELGPGSVWAGQVRSALTTPERQHRDQFIAVCERAGDVCVHTAHAETQDRDDFRYGLAVTSVIGAAEVPAADVLAAAHQLAHAVATRSPVVRRSLFDLSPGETPLWTLREQTTFGGREELCTAVLPAWAAHSEHDLDFPGSGIGVAARALAELLGLPADGYEAKQSAVARYSRVGFEAAAVSGLGIPLGHAPQEAHLQRVAQLRFGHPYAVVAVTTHERLDRHTGRIEPGPWHGLPVFSAWIADIQDAGDLR
jgi:hypothetical protein